VAEAVLRLLNSSSDSVSVAASKPSAIVGARCAKVAITRKLVDYVARQSAHHPLSSLSALLHAVVGENDNTEGLHHAAIALGSNMGDRFRNIELALRHLEGPEPSDTSEKGPIVRIVDTSFLYETAPMYVTDQSHFINGACLVRHVHSHVYMFADGRIWADRN
jgi:dihydroneopterin aldolase/2-amino-4-hydroxy-6-hydroxymethyldihydropteridine diphosphokinase/dihydropteroate synthase